MHGTSVPTVSAGYCGVDAGDFDISLVNNPDCHIVNTMEQEWGSLAVLVLVSLAAFALSGYATRYALGYHEKKHRKKRC